MIKIQFAIISLSGLLNTFTVHSKCCAHISAQILWPFTR